MLWCKTENFNRSLRGLDTSSKLSTNNTVSTSMSASCKEILNWSKNKSKLMKRRKSNKLLDSRNSIKMKITKSPTARLKLWNRSWKTLTQVNCAFENKVFKTVYQCLAKKTSRSITSWNNFRSKWNPRILWINYKWWKNKTWEVNLENSINFYKDHQFLTFQTFSPSSLCCSNNSSSSKEIHKLVLEELTRDKEKQVLTKRPRFQST